jgi:(p)ppGpp synthase/HD superfamily hydrolase
MNHGYSDRVAHALAFTAKHGAARTRRGSGGSYLTQPANIAVILARYGADEVTIVAGILTSLLNETEPRLRDGLMQKVTGKFGERVSEVLRQTVEPKYDARGKERSWEASKMEFLANVTGADQRALEVCAASEIYQCGAVVTDARRLGTEYLSGYAPGGAPALLRWFQGVIDALERHPTGPRPGMLAELRDLSSRLRDTL